MLALSGGVTSHPATMGILKIISIGIVIQELKTSINIVMKEIPLNRKIHHLNVKYDDLFS